MGIEPVISSPAGACLPPLVLFRSAKVPNTRIVKAITPSSVARLGANQGTAKRCGIMSTQAREGAFRLEASRNGNFYSTGA